MTAKAKSASQHPAAHSGKAQPHARHAEAAPTKGRSAGSAQTKHRHSEPPGTEARQPKTPPSPKAPPQAPAHAEIEKISAEYDQAIQGYADYYLQQQGLYSPGYLPGSGYDSGYSGYQQAQQGYGQAPWEGFVSTDEERLYLMEQAACDFHASLPYLRSLRGSEKDQYIAGWRDYLTQFAELGAELIDALERELSTLSVPD